MATASAASAASNSDGPSAPGGPGEVVLPVASQAGAPVPVPPTLAQRLRAVSKRTLDSRFDVMIKDLVGQLEMTASGEPQQAEHVESFACSNVRGFTALLMGNGEDKKALRARLYAVLAAPPYGITAADREVHLCREPNGYGNSCTVGCGVGGISFKW